MRAAVIVTLYPPSREHPPRVVDEAHAHQWSSGVLRELRSDTNLRGLVHLRGV